MKVGAMFPGAYLKAADLQGRKVGVTIREVSLEDIGGEHKPVLYFEGKDKGVVLNKTNANMIAEIAGTEETDDWSGVRIILKPDRTDFQGKRVDCIRVEAPGGNGGAPKQAQQRQQPEREPGEDEIPW